MPRVFGSVSEISTSRLDRAQGGALTAVAGIEEASTIAIYAKPGCTGPEVATGNASELENSGIQVTVSADSSTTFSATDSDLSGTSECSNAITYRQVSDPPSSPTISAVNPASPANNNLPSILGSADAGSTVSLFTNPTCSGSAAGTGSASAFSTSGIQVAVPDNSTTTFYAQASWAELPSACSSTSVTYQEVSAAPPVDPGEGGTGPSEPVGSPPADGPSAASAAPAAPKLRTVPGGRSNDLTPLVAGSASGAVTVQIYENAACSGRPVASGSVSQLAAGFPLQVTENASTRFFGEAVAADGKTSGCSEPVVYIEDSSPPQARITFGPGVKTRKRVAVFRFTDVTEDAPGTTFSCKFDRGPWKACQAPLRLPHLRPKAHELRVKAIDAAGNEEPGAVAWRFKVIRASP